MALKLPLKKRIDLFPTSKTIDEGINAQKSGTGLQTINGCKFMTIRPQSDTFHYEESGHLHVTNFQDPQMVFVAVELPQGAVIHRFGIFGTMGALDKVQFQRTKLKTGTAELLYDDTGANNKMGKFNCVIDNENYAYMITGESSGEYYGAKIEYAY